MSKLTLDATQSNDSIKESVITVLGEYYGGLTDYDTIKNHLQESLEAMFAPYDYIRFNQKRLINNFNGFLRNVALEREVNYSAQFVSKPSKKNELITFTGKLNDAVIQIKVKKRQTYMSDFQSILCSETGKDPIYMIKSNEEACDFIKKRRDLKYGVFDTISDCISKIQKETDYSKKHMRCSELKNILEDVLNLTIFYSNFSKYADILEKVVKAETLNPSKSKLLFKRVELGYDPDERRIKVNLIY